MRNEFAPAKTSILLKEAKQGDLPRNFTNYQKVEKDHGKILAKFLFIFVLYIYDKLLIIFMPIIIFII